MEISLARSGVIKSLRILNIHNNQQYHSFNYTLGYSITQADTAIAGHSSLVALIQRYSYDINNIYILCNCKRQLSQETFFSSLYGSYLQMPRHVKEKFKGTESKGGQDSATEALHVGERAQIHSQKVPAAMGTTDKRTQKSRHGKEV